MWRTRPKASTERWEWNVLSRGSKSNSNERYAGKRDEGGAEKKGPVQHLHERCENRRGQPRQITAWRREWRTTPQVMGGVVRGIASVGGRGDRVDKGGRRAAQARPTLANDGVPGREGRHRGLEEGRGARVRTVEGNGRGQGRRHRRQETSAR